MKNLMFLFFFITGLLGAKAQRGEIIIKVKDTVSIGTPFKLEIELNNIQGGFKTPNFPGLRLVGGPNTSSSMTIINGASNSKVVYIYYLMAEEEGNYSIILHEMETGDEILAFEEIQITALTSSSGDSQMIKYYESSSPSEPKIQNSKRKIRKI